ncbi:hypothetical protein TorRG33x02_085840 [Trema orientale]|uniref:Uncharacterized protein n=1 Tax=Trema orientale TaxID=63057 RepID=A0A2P5FD89_TREOI|nr:hypothetical protein TorRG33x02_085840 [Trema orientale]
MAGARGSAVRAVTVSAWLARIAEVEGLAVVVGTSLIRVVATVAGAEVKGSAVRVRIGSVSVAMTVAGAEVEGLAVGVRTGSVWVAAIVVGAVITLEAQYVWIEVSNLRK